MSAHEEWDKFFEELPYGTFCKMCDQIDELQSECDNLQGQVISILSDLGNAEDFIQRLMAELAQHGWGDMHYGSQHQDPAIAALLKEGGFGNYGDTVNINEDPNAFERGDTQTSSGSDAPPIASNRGSWEWQDSMGWCGRREVADGPGILQGEGGTG